MASSSTSAPALSIVIPAPDDAAALEATLVSVLENTPPNAEVVVAPGFAYADPWGIAEEVRFVPAPPGSGRVSCTNVGIAASAAPVVHVLAAGWLATPGWTDQPLDMFAAGDVLAVVPAGVAAADPERIVAAGVRATRGGRRVTVVPPRGASCDAAVRSWPAAPLLEAGFWRADVLVAAGPGFATCCGDWLADADMAAAVAALPGRVTFAPDSKVVCGRTRSRPRSFTAGLQAERLFWRSLARGSLPAALSAHALEVLRDAVAAAPFGTLPALAGRLVALMQFGDFVARFAQLRDLRREAAAAARETLRIDAEHAPMAPPRRQPITGQELRRSA